MPSIARILEILLYSVTIFVPWLLVTYYPFRTQLRLSANVVALFAAVMAAGRIALDLASGLGLLNSTTVIQIILTLVYILCFFASVRAPLAEMIVNLVLVLALAFLSTTTVDALEPVLTPQLAHTPYNWAYSVILLALEGIIAIMYCLLYDSVKPAIAALCKKVLAAKPKEVPAAEEKAEKEEPAEAAEAPAAEEEAPKTEPAPAAEEEKEESPAEEEVQPAPLKEEPAEPAPAPVAEAPAVEAPKETAPEPVPAQVPAEPAPAAPQEPETPTAPSVSNEQLLSMQFTSLNSRILESRQVRKDLRRQIDTMADCLNTKNYDRLRALLMAMRQQFSTTSYGSNAALSAPLDYFAQIARSRGIRMDIDVELPNEIPESIYPMDLIVVIGNLLDNALDACKAQKKPDRRISISITQKEQALCFVVENTYELPVRQDENGAYLSSKYDGPGAGLQVVRNITQRYNGELSIAHTNTSFQVSATLNA